MPHYLAACEGNAQSRSTFRLCQKMGAVPQKALRVPFPLQWGQFLLGWDRSFQVFRQTDLLHGVIGLISISSLAVKLLLESIHCLIFLGEIAVHIQRYLFLLLFTSLPFYEFVEKIDWQMVKYKP